ncbi:hypothetical protein PHLGIDRAFT_33815 [Phlebiopsis gigantea 11061_1 CR5-6]|uniref:DUF1682-domain-containing protein n=1 Tax=Phlebiopsis gigantea (strain 11061_1 CR5-6) TaxID=745531 RepID=A0A0C3S4D5_PHLG1|nr:hypothetical protein PHLGIDRAFT_33815 [Phlebiopsis gigantea 11061_1 CR5-6]
MASQALKQVLLLLTPPPLVVPEDYDGVEFRWKFLVFRPGLFQKEALFLSAVLLYIAWYFIGKSYNIKKATTWFEAHLPLYTAQFTRPVQPGGLTKDGSSDFFAYSTGRRAISSLHTTITLRPYHDFWQLAYQTLRGIVEITYRAEDEVELEFTFQDSADVPGCIWAIVAKDELKDIKDRRWDLSFARVTESQSLPPSLSVMSEFADITENLLKQHGPLSLAKTLADPALLPYFRSLSLTDQPRARPAAPLPLAERKRRLILLLTLPPATDAQATVPLVTAVFQLLDVVAGTGGWGVGRGAGGKGAAGLAQSLRPETRTKLRATREKLEKELLEESSRDQREEEEEKRAAAKKKAVDERLSRLSAAEQKKELEKEKRRMLRKTQGKIAKR